MPTDQNASTLRRGTVSGSDVKPSTSKVSGRPGLASVELSSHQGNALIANADKLGWLLLALLIALLLMLFGAALARRRQPSEAA